MSTNPNIFNIHKVFQVFTHVYSSESGMCILFGSRFKWNTLYINLHLRPYNKHTYTLQERKKGPRCRKRKKISRGSTRSKVMTMVSQYYSKKIYSFCTTLSGFTGGSRCNLRESELKKTHTHIQHIAVQLITSRYSSE